MTITTPPRLATWLLQHLGPRYQSESLAGDLFEEYQQGRSQAWYWRQTVAAVLVGRAVRLGALLPRAHRAPASASRSRRTTLIKRLISAFLITALGAGALTWAAGLSHTSEQQATEGKLVN